MKFKDFQASALFSSTFKALNLGEKKFKHFQGLSRMRGNPGISISQAQCSGSAAKGIDVVAVIASSVYATDVAIAILYVFCQRRC